jgi:hypothetical protein
MMKYMGPIGNQGPLSEEGADTLVELFHHLWVFFSDHGGIVFLLLLAYGVFLEMRRK